MTNATIAFNRLVAARAEGGNAHAVQAAQNLVAQHFPGRIFDAETAVNRVFNALDQGNRAGAEEAINEALVTLNTPVRAETVAADAPDLVSRVAALEDLARRNGLTVGDVASLTLEARVTSLENLAARHGLR